ncbi:MAG TPA: class I SAM-dependent methyltransferase [Gaiellaceae bacterium]|nr:class I SAM-dependent methyltransferase [Gaiellaceae bacterium]
MGLRSRLFALTYDRQLAKVEKAGLGEQRRRLIGGASGRVLEIGGGTGANLRHYGPGVELTVTEPDEPMLKRLRRRVDAEAPETAVVQASAEALPFDDASFDTAVSTLVLCGVDQARALGELRRVLRPGGRLLFLEHVRSEDPGRARWQDRVNFLNRFVACCDCNRRTLASIEAAGFGVEEVEHTELAKAPPFVRPLIIGAATSP